MKQYRANKLIRTLAINIILIIAAVLCLFPLIMALMNSFKTNGELLNNIMAFPHRLMLDNYYKSLDKMHYARSFMNILTITVISVGGIVLVSSMAGWKLSRTKTRLSGFFYGLFVFSMLIPFHSIMIPLFRIANQFHINNSLIGLAMIYIGLGVSMSIFLYSGFVKGIPKELEDAARMDGCGQFKIFFRVIFPLLRPITMTIAIMNVLWIWNDFLLPLIMLQDTRKYTLLLSTNMLFGQYTNDWAAISSALVLVAIPVIIFYSLFQKYILQGITDGAVKG